MADIFNCVTDSAGQTKKVGTLFAKTLLSHGSFRQAFVVALKGDLGAGKTQFVQGFSKGLGLGAAINSPTFVILKKYYFKKPIFGFKMFYHIDCYRLDSAADLKYLGIEEIFNDPANIVAIEWPQIIVEILPKSSMSIILEVAGKNKRNIIMGSL